VEDFHEERLMSPEADKRAACIVEMQEVYGFSVDPTPVRAATPKRRSTTILAAVSTKS
jgi:hypothetical protein